MSTSYKTPGVYVEEITKLPPSVAEVETAIPAFIGYTEKALKQGQDLTNKPTKVRDLKQFELWFGGKPQYEVDTVALDANNLPVPEKCKVKNSNYYLYNSIRLFYDNGGGTCYIVSVGNYASEIKFGDDNSGLKFGLNELRKFDEPTLILFPDAVNIKDPAQLGGLQQASLLQCDELGDRFSIFDIKDTSDLDADVESFRNNIGMNSLKYGAVYHPWVNTIYEEDFRLFEIMNSLKTATGDAKIDIKSLFQDAAVLNRIDNFVKLNDDINTKIKQGFLDFYASLDPTGTAYNSLGQYYNSQKADSVNPATALSETFKALYSGLLTINTISESLSNTDLKNTIKNYSTHSIKATLTKLFNLDVEAYMTSPPSMAPTSPPSSPPNPGDINHGGTIFNSFFKGAAGTQSIYGDLNTIEFSKTDSIVGATSSDRIVSAFKALSQIVTEISNHFSTISTSAKNNADALELALINDIPWYPAVLKALNSKVTQIPPSGGVAGIYAAVDNDRGVWKAPANTSVNSVSTLSVFIDDRIQEGLNVDVDAGKSVNAIRDFIGKGRIIWGARTLAGNDNEWRYVSVRRFFSFVEESSKKSTSWAVFEPNDANTWLRIRVQIENFLSNLWRRGALAGAKPADAFEVYCGLGTTMNSQDILEGRLIIEIRMAAVRPAEFIILKFSHKLQTS